MQGWEMHLGSDAFLTTSRGQRLVKWIHLIDVDAESCPIHLKTFCTLLPAWLGMILYSVFTQPGYLFMFKLVLQPVNKRHSCMSFYVSCELTKRERNRHSTWPTVGIHSRWPTIGVHVATGAETISFRSECAIHTHSKQSNFKERLELTDRENYRP